ncbi:MAG: hypothetical protein ACFFG0_18765 [Candidatus Thorarchaeota archaeon]
MEKSENSELNRLIHQALASNSNMKVPSGLTEKTIQRLEKKILLKELVLELSVKIGIVSGSLLLLTGIFVWINGNKVITRIYQFVLNHSQQFLSILILGLITILIDQIGLKYYQTVKKEKRISGHVPNQ